VPDLLWEELPFAHFGLAFLVGGDCLLEKRSDLLSVNLALRVGISNPERTIPPKYSSW
jgi:hypothetical protein